MIRAATVDDFPRLAEMGSKFMASSRYGDFLPTTPKMLEALLAVITEVGVVLVCERVTLKVPQLSYPGRAPIIAATEEHPAIGSDHNLVGMIALVALPHPMTGEVYVEEMAWWVEPDHRGSVGPRLHIAGEEWAKAKGISLMRMLSPAGSDLGIYYGRRGYVEVETAWVKRL